LENGDENLAGVSHQNELGMSAVTLQLYLHFHSIMPNFQEIIIIFLRISWVFSVLLCNCFLI